MQIDGQSRLNFYISGVNFPIISLPGCQCIITTNVKQPLPSLRIVINDPISVINTALPIVDGTLLGVIMDDTSTNDPTQVQFRAFGTPKRSHMPNHSDQTVYTITGLLDSIPFIRSNPNTTLTGTSNTVMKNIATQNGFNFVTNVSGNDSMTWLPAKKTWAGFAEYVSKHSYIDNNSVQSWGIDEQKNLYFANIVPLFSKPPVAYIYFGAPNASTNSNQQTQSNTFVALQYRAINRSGLFNSLGGYGQRTVQQTLSGPNQNKYLATDATVTTNQLDINSNVSGAIKPVSKMSLPAADCGNSHDNYIQARHQNHRLKCTYVQNVYVMLYQKSGLKLFDTVSFTSTTEGNNTNSLVNGTYIVTATSRVYWSNRYYEKLELTNNGPITANTVSGLLS
jgi:hypothetical protein